MEKLERGMRVRARSEIRGSFGTVIHEGCRGIVSQDRGTAYAQGRPQIIAVRWCGFLKMYLTAPEVERIP